MKPDALIGQQLKSFCVKSKQGVERAQLTFVDNDGKETLIVVRPDSELTNRIQVIVHER